MEQTVTPQPTLTQPIMPQEAAPNFATAPAAPHTEETMWTSFQTVLTFISLAFFAGSIYTLWSTFINNWVPNVSEMGQILQAVSATLINGAIASLIVAAPVFIGLFYWTNKKYSEEPLLKKAKSKKMLTYITLIITFIILLAQAIGAINTALNDSFTMNFGLQLLLTFIVTGSIFLYYLYEVRIEKQPASKNVYAAACGMLVLLSIITFGIALKVRSDIKLKEAQTPNPYQQMYGSQQRPYVAPSMEPTATYSPVINQAEPAQTMQQAYTPVTPTTNGKSVISVSTNTPTQMLTVGGIKMVVNQVEATSENGVNELEVTVTFTADKDCTADKAACYTNVGGVQFMDEDSGNKLIGDHWMDRGALQDRRLLAGEKQTGKEYFQILNPAKQYSVTYNNNKGVYSAKQSILMRDAVSTR